MPSEISTTNSEKINVNFSDYFVKHVHPSYSQFPNIRGKEGNIYIYKKQILGMFNS